MSFSGHNFIAGQRSALGDTLVYSVDAHTGERLPGGFHQATLSEVDSAVAGASAAFPVFRSLPAVRRAEFLDAIADELDALGEDFVALTCRETALPSARIQGSAVAPAARCACSPGAAPWRLLRCAHRPGAARAHAAATSDLRQYRIGVGPVAVFGASNFPLAFSTAGGDTAAALAAGCPVVFKAHSGHMATAERVAEALLRAADKTGMPAGVFNMIFGGGVGEALVKHPGIQAVGFTGSLKGGRALCDMAAARPQPIPVFAEMSSINPVLALPQALASRGAQMARELAASVVQGCGQFCTNPGLVLGIRSPAFTTFIEQLGGHLAEQAPQTMLNAGTLASYGKGPAGTAGAPRHPAPERPGTSRQPGPAAAVRRRCQPAAGTRRVAAGRGVRPLHHRDPGGQRRRAAARRQRPAWPAHRHAAGRR
ncbi:aldehyde dehydrogenase family protein [Pseudomonas qingdaonensis]|nr:aldehyde dehydrogenase family protein [Pseudomonas qingdaonensis]